MGVDEISLENIGPDMESEGLVDVTVINQPENSFVFKCWTQHWLHTTIQLSYFDS